MTEANAWWRNLSINQMKTLEKKYFPTWRSGTHNRMIHEMWENEGKPTARVVACKRDVNIHGSVADATGGCGERATGGAGGEEHGRS